jgi:hypothetical protein
MAENLYATGPKEPIEYFSEQVKKLQRKTSNGF